MAKPLGIELSGGLCHVISRGSGRGDIYRSDPDRRAWLEIFGNVCERFNRVCHAWCRITNHCHAVVETPEADLAQGMRQLDGVYTQYVSRATGAAGTRSRGATRRCWWRRTATCWNWRAT